jgi:hypothetical protein
VALFVAVLCYTPIHSARLQEEKTNSNKKGNRANRTEANIHTRNPESDAQGIVTVGPIISHTPGQKWPCVKLFWGLKYTFENVRGVLNGVCEFVWRLLFVVRVSCGKVRWCANATKCKPNMYDRASIIT